jgi:hypothetical protein
MRAYKDKRFPKSALDRYAELILRQVYQAGGRHRYVPVAELEDALGLERDLILGLCRTKLLGELHVADRITDELEDDAAFCSVIERQMIRTYFARPHVRIRPEAVRLTEDELVAGRRKRKRKKKRKKRK